MNRGDGNRGSGGGGRSEGNLVVYAAIGLAIGAGVGVADGFADGFAVGADFDSRRRG